MLSDISPISRTKGAIQCFCLRTSLLHYTAFAFHNQTVSETCATCLAFSIYYCLSRCFDNLNHNIIIICLKLIVAHGHEWPWPRTLMKHTSFTRKSALFACAIHRRACPACLGSTMARCRSKEAVGPPQVERGYACGSIESRQNDNERVCAVL